MSATEDGPTVEVYENRQPEAEMTKTHEFDVQGPARDPAPTYKVREWTGTVTIEYKPGQYSLDEGALTDVVDAKAEAAEQPEDAVFEIYQSIVDAVFPAHAGYDDPWNKVPLVVTLEYHRGEEKSTATLGQYR